MPIFEGQPQSVIYDPIIGYLTDSSGNPITTESVTYAQFTDAGFDLSTARHVVVSDRHSTRDASDLCKSLGGSSQLMLLDIKGFCAHHPSIALTRLHYHQRRHLRTDSLTKQI